MKGTHSALSFRTMVIALLVTGLLAAPLQAQPFAPPAHDCCGHCGGWMDSGNQRHAAAMLTAMTGHGCCSPAPSACTCEFRPVPPDGESQAVLSPRKGFHDSGLSKTGIQQHFFSGHNSHSRSPFNSHNLPRTGTIPVYLTNQSLLC